MILSKLEVTEIERSDLLPGTFVLEVKAIDGDRGVNYDNITYEIVRQGRLKQPEKAEKDPEYFIGTY